MNPRKALDAQGIILMTLLCLIWGLQQIALKAAAADAAPLMQIALRTGISAILVAGLMRWRGMRLTPTRRTWRAGLLVSVLFSLEFFLVGEALRYTSASHTVVLLYTSPIFVALGLHWKLPDERLGRLQWSGIALAFAGIVATFLGRGSSTHGALPQVLYGDLLALGGGAAWGATTVVVRLTRLSRAPAGETLFYQLAGGFVLLTLAAVGLGQTQIRPTPLFWQSLLFQSVIVSFASYLAWFWLLKRYLASRLGVFSFLTPLFGMLFGVWLLQEPMEANFVIGTALVLAGVMLVSGAGWLGQALSRPHCAHAARQPR